MTDPINIDLWVFPLDRTDDEFAWLGSLCSPAERKRASHFASPIDRHQRLAARGLLRRVLASYLELPPEHIEFSTGPFGKPQLAACPAPVAFNVSHSEGIVALAVCRHIEVGIDIEAVRPIEEPIAGLVLTEREQILLSTLKGEEWQDAFYRAWTRKEALVKAMGTGLNHPLQNLEVSFGPGESARMLVVDGDRASNWTLIHIEPRVGFIGAIALRTKGRDVKISPRNICDLTSKLLPGSPEVEPVHRPR